MRWGGVSCGGLPPLVGFNFLCGGSDFIESCKNCQVFFVKLRELPEGEAYGFNRRINP